MAKAALPKITVIRPKAKNGFEDNKEWLYELKYDGFRGLLYLEEKRCRFESRNNKDMPRFSELCEKLARTLHVATAILDGEIVAYTEEERPDFMLLLRMGAQAFIAFDLLWQNGEDLRGLPLSERRKRLRRLLPKNSSLITEPVSIEEHGHKLFDAVCHYDLEGIVMKRLADPYRKSTRWYKILNPVYTQKKGRTELFNKQRGLKKRR